MGFEFFDMTIYQKNGVLSEKDYNSFSRKIVQSINPVRVNNIRKNLEFKAFSYVDYSKEDFKEFLEDGDFSISLELNSISIPLSTSFNSNFFPNFELEYLNPFGSMGFVDDFVHIEEIQEIPLKQVMNSNFHSLAIAAYDLEQLIKESIKQSSLWKVSEDISVIIEFYIPEKISCNFDITIKVICTFYEI